MSARMRGEEDPRQRESEESYRTIFELADVGMAQADPSTGRLLLVNSEMCEIVGYPEEELLGMNFLEITHPEDREEDLERFRRMISGDAPEYENEKRYVRKDCSAVWARVKAKVIRDEAGRPLRTVAVIQDITARKRIKAPVPTGAGLAVVRRGRDRIPAAPRRYRPDRRPESRRQLRRLARL